MLGTIKKHWTSLLGAVFTFVAFIYLFNFAIDKIYISNTIKIGIGLAVGTIFIPIGITFNKKNYNTTSQILNGLGVSILYFTCSFAGVYYSIWDSTTVFITMIIITAFVSVYSYQTNSRLLMNLSILGALIAPLTMKPHGDQVFSLFIYLLIINSAYFYTSISKKWIELRIIPFLGTWLLYTIYYLHFEPESYIKPLFYATSAFLFYIIGFMFSSWKEDKKYDGANLYLGILNGIMYFIWSMYISSGIIDPSIISASIGFIYIIAAFILYNSIKNFTIPVILKSTIGVALILISCTNFAANFDIRSMIIVLLWAAISVVLLTIGQAKKSDISKVLSISIWFIIVIYWFATTWTTPLGEFFGVFIPILNLSGITWVVLAAIGFYFSSKVTFNENKYINREFTITFATIIGVISHLIVGGLLTFQIDNLWEVYELKFIDLWLTLSLSWGIYALLLFVWGAYTKEKIYKVFGSIVLVVVAIKTLIFDLSDAHTLFKIAVLVLLAGISFSITYINNKFSSKDEKKAVRAD